MDRCNDKILTSWRPRPAVSHCTRRGYTKSPTFHKQRLTGGFCDSDWEKYQSINFPHISNIRVSISPTFPTSEYQNHPHFQRQSIKMSQVFERRSWFYTRNYAKICGIGRIMRNYAENVKLCEIMRQIPYYAKSCGICQIMRFRTRRT